MSVVEKLYNAYKTNTQLPLKSLDLKDDLEYCYAVQDQVVALKEQSGEKAKGYKVSLTSETTQKMFNSDQPLYGNMTDVTDLSVKPEVSLAKYNQPLLELELVFLVDEDLEVTDTAEDVLRKCRVAPGLEVPDSRFAEWFPHTTLYEVVADGAVNGAVLYGEGKHYTYEQLANVKGKLYFNDEFVCEGLSSEVLGHPVNTMLWLVKALAGRGKKLTKGHFVSSGTFVLPVRLQPGVYRADYEGVGEVSLTVKP